MSVPLGRDRFCHFLGLSLVLKRVWFSSGPWRWHCRGHSRPVSEAECPCLFGGKRGMPSVACEPRVMGEVWALSSLLIVVVLFPGNSIYRASAFEYVSVSITLECAINKDTEYLPLVPI